MVPRVRRGLACGVFIAWVVTSAGLPRNAGARPEDPPAESVEARDKRWAEEARRVAELRGKADQEAALKAGRLLLAEQEKVLGPDDARVGETLVTVAGLCGDTGDPVAARAGFERALRILEPARGKDSMAVAEALAEFGWFLRAQKEPKAAEPLLRRALTIAETAAGPDAKETSRLVGYLGQVLLDLDMLREARPLLERALAATETEHGADSVATADVLSNLGYLHWKAGEHAKARVLFERTVAIRDARLGPATLLTLTAVLNLGHACAGEGRVDEAVAAFERVVANAKQILPRGERLGLVRARGSGVPAARAGPAGARARGLRASARGQHADPGARQAADVDRTPLPRAGADGDGAPLGGGAAHPSRSWTRRRSATAPSIRPLRAPARGSACSASGRAVSRRRSGSSRRCSPRTCVPTESRAPRWRRRWPTWP